MGSEAAGLALPLVVSGAFVYLLGFGVNAGGWLKAL